MIFFRGIAWCEKHHSELVEGGTVPVSLIGIHGQYFSQCICDGRGIINYLYEWITYNSTIYHHPKLVNS